MTDLDTLVAAFGEVTAKVHKRVRVLIAATGIEAEGVMKQEAPVDTGALRASIHHRIGAMGEEVTIAPTVYYSPYVAYGTRRQRPNPFDLRTVQRVGPRFHDRAEQIMEDLL